MLTQDTALPADLDLALVELDDLRTAFGGEAAKAPAQDSAAAVPTSTVMCPNW